MATSVSQFGVFTWEFDADYTVGQYANGDYYVVAPAGLTITNITPASAVIASRPNNAGGTTLNSIVNGSMINPDAHEGTQSQGFDSAMDENPWDAALNVARPNGLDLSALNPLVVPAGSTLVSTQSRAVADVRPQIQDGAYLTVVATAPDADSFRPAPHVADKTPLATVADLDYSILKNYPAVTGTPALATLESYFVRPWFEFNCAWTGRFMHPLNNQPDYGRDIAKRLGLGLASLNHVYSNAAKETLYIRLVQYGLDVYGAASVGGRWGDNGGHNNGRKMPMLLAGLAIDNADIIARANAEDYFIFSEDRSTFFVNPATQPTPTQNDGRPRTRYTVRTSEVTISQASPAVVTWANHGLYGTQTVWFTTTGTLPAPLQPNIEYVVGGTEVVMNAPDLVVGQYVDITSVGTTNFVAMGAGGNSVSYNFRVNSTGSGTGTVTGLPHNTFSIRDSYSGALINTTDAGSGTHTCHFDMTGVAEWGEKHTTAPNRDGSNLNAIYRPIVYGEFIMHALVSTMVTGAEAAWGWPAFVAYNDRIFNRFILASNSETTPYEILMWQTYRTPPNTPNPVSVVVNSDGDEATLVWSESCTNGTGGATGMTFSGTGGPAELIYISGSGSDTYIFGINRTIVDGEVLALSYLQPGNGIEATADGTDVTSFFDIQVTNNSTQNVPAEVTNLKPQRLFAGGGGF